MRRSIMMAIMAVSILVITMVVSCFLFHINPVRPIVSLLDSIRNHQKDQQLINAIHRAIVNQCTPQSAERVVGIPAAINTDRLADRDVLEFADFSDDLDCSTKLPTDLRSGKHVIYWVRPIRADHYSKIVGIIWSDEDEAKIFFGVVVDEK